MTDPPIAAAAQALVGILVDAAIRGLVLAVVVGGVLAVLPVRRAADRLAAWRLVLYAAFAMPLIAQVAPAFVVPVPALATLATPADGISAALTTESAGVAAAADGWSEDRTIWLSSAALALAIYFLGVISLGIRAALGWIAARRLDRHARSIAHTELVTRGAELAAAVGVRRVPRLAEADDLDVPLTLGVRRPVVILPAGWSAWPPAMRDAVLIHELSHVRRGDALTQQLAVAFRTLFWPSPLGWWLRRRLATLAEEASDEAALARGVEPTRYADILLNFLIIVRDRPRRAAWHLAMARVAGAERRVERVLAWKGSRPMGLSKRVAVVGSIAAAVVVWGAATIRPVSVSAAELTLPDVPAMSAPVSLPVADSGLNPQNVPPPPPPPPPSAPAQAQAVVPPPPPPPPPDPKDLVPDDDFAKGAMTPGTPGLTMPVVLRHVQPKYTSSAMRAKVEGTVVVQAIVDVDGTVSKARVIGSLDPDLDEQALVAARQWLYRPGTLDGRTVPVVVLVTLEFRLH
jgi:TonB family protein